MKFPIPPITTPAPREKFLESHSEREAITRLRLHLMMARIRSGLRRYMSVYATPNAEELRKTLTAYLALEVGVLMEILGFIHIQGFRIETPFLVQELSYLYFGGWTEAWGTDTFYMECVNQEFNAMEDQLILETSNHDNNPATPFVYWWRPEFELKENAAGFSRTNILAHFNHYYGTVVLAKFGKHVLNERSFIVPFLDTKEVIPGLDARPPAKPDVGPSAQNSNTEANPCPKCNETKAIVKAALSKLALTRASVAADLREAEEAAFRSCDQVNMYTALEKISDDYDPFGRGTGQPTKLPKDLEKEFPEHPDKSPSELPTPYPANLPDFNIDPFNIMVDRTRYHFIAFKETWEHPVESLDPAKNVKLYLGPQFRVKKTPSQNVDNIAGPSTRSVNIAAGQPSKTDGFDIPAPDAPHSHGSSDVSSEKSVPIWYIPDDVNDSDDADEDEDENENTDEDFDISV